MFSRSNVLTNCRKFESRLEDYLGGAADPELDQHLAACPRCRGAVESSRQAGHLLRGAYEPAREPSQFFLANVMTRIKQEKLRAQSRIAFWTPLEFLASRLSLTAAMLLLALSAYLVKFAPQRTAPPPAARTELRSSDFPQPPGDPVSNEEVLQSLAERNDGR